MQKLTGKNKVLLKNEQSELWFETTKHYSTWKSHLRSSSLKEIRRLFLCPLIIRRTSKIDSFPCTTRTTSTSTNSLCNQQGRFQEINENERVWKMSQNIRRKTACSVRSLQCRCSMWISFTTLYQTTTFVESKRKKQLYLLWFAVFTENTYY